ncbi:MAG: tetratricopeptide repeat protein [Deltaproteobacteria bacterium]|nr:tetratricopeptide repeat protein [Deltaproteobacteria bacterium]
MASDAKKYTEALAAYDRALAIDPTHDDARLGRGRVFEDQELFDDAIREYKAVLSRNNKHVAAHLILANAYRRVGNLPLAISNAERAAQLSPGEAWIRNIIGQLLEQNGDLPGAKERFLEAIGLVSNDAEFHLNLAKVLEKLGERERAIAEYTAYLELVAGLEKYREQINFCNARIRALRGA